MSRLASFFGFTEPNDRIMRMARLMVVFLPLISVTFMLSTTFYVIFIAEALGSGDFMQGMGLVGILVVIQMTVQTVFDYPTGGLGDWLGQRYIIASAFLLYGVSFYMVSLVTSATPFLFLVAIYALQGFASAQESGAFGAWFDNNYRAAMPEDTDRKQYGVFQGRIGMVFQIVATLSLIPGAVLALLFQRAWVFQLQAVLSVVIAFAVFKYVVDFPEVREAREKRPSTSEYLSILKSGVSFLFGDKFIKYLVIGGMLTISSIMVWGNLILFPFYYSYLVTDVAVASYRTILFLPGVAAQERSGVWSKRFEPTKWIPRFRFLQTCGFVFFGILAAITYFFPPALPGAPTIDVLWPFTDLIIISIPQQSVIPVTLAFITFTATGIFGGFAEILTQRMLLDVIPNRIRNSVYSLIPTVAIVLAIPQIALFGMLVPMYGFPLTLTGVAIVSLMGVLLIRHGLAQPKPIPTEDTWATPSPESDVLGDKSSEEFTEPWPTEVFDDKPMEE